ncbi:MAG TPA: hypothetical protein VIY26_00060 [Acidimicrobiales bacterium]
MATPHDQRRHPLREVGAVQHGDDLASPIDARAEGAKDGSASLGVGQGVEDGKDLDRVASERRVEDAQQAGAGPTHCTHWRQPQEGHQDLSTGYRGETQKRADRTPDAPAADENETFAALGELVGELRGDAAPERVPDDGHSIHSEHRDKVPHAVGKAGDRVVGPRLLGAPMAQEVGRDDRVVAGEFVEDGPPGVRAVADAVDEQ